MSLKQKFAQVLHHDAEKDNVQIPEDVVLKIEDLTITFDVDGDVCEAVTDVNLELKKGQTLGLVGETGAGKTTTALACLNLIPNPPGVIHNGRVYVCGKNILTQNTTELEYIRGRDISMIFQDPMTALNPVFTVGEQIAESIRLHKNLGKAEAFKAAQEMLETVGIPAYRANEYPHQFSGGMKQRVVIAIALACNPHILLCDEPTTALDVTIQAQVLDLMKDLRQKFGTASLMITHDLGIVAESCDDVAVMYAGRIVEQGTLDEVFNDTLHPYTEGLFNSLPNIHDREARLKPIKGLMPDPNNLPKGCAFAERCEYACDKCKEARPEKKYVSDTHFVACCRYDEPDFKIERSKKK